MSSGDRSTNGICYLFGYVPGFPRGEKDLRNIVFPAQTVDQLKQKCNFNLASTIEDCSVGENGLEFRYNYSFLALRWSRLSEPVA